MNTHMNTLIGPNPKSMPPRMYLSILFKIYYSCLPVTAFIPGVRALIDIYFCNLLDNTHLKSGK